MLGSWHNGSAFRADGIMVADERENAGLERGYHHPPQPTPVPSEFSQMVTPSDPIQWGVRPEPPKDLGALDSGGHFPPGTDSGQQAFQASAAVAGPLRSPWALGRRLEDAASSWGHPQTS